MAARKAAGVRSKANNGTKPRDREEPDGSTGPSRLQSDASGRIVEFFSKDDVCPVCKSDRYLNPNLRLLVSQCYHRMCESCIDRIYTLGPEPCPTCAQILRKSSFSPQTFENLGVEKEVFVRRNISKVFNKREEDYATLQDYNDYLEEVEELTFNLIHGIDLPQTEARIKDFEAENEDTIALNSVRSLQEVQQQKHAEETLQRQRQARVAYLMRMEEQDAAEERRSKDMTLRRLEKSNAGADELISRQLATVRKKKANRAAEFSVDNRRDSMHLSPLAEVVTAEGFDPARTDDYADLWAAAPTRPLVDPYGFAGDAQTSVGGYLPESAWEKDLRGAVTGLFCI